MFLQKWTQLFKSDVYNIQGKMKNVILTQLLIFDIFSFFSFSSFPFWKHALSLVLKSPVSSLYNLEIQYKIKYRYFSLSLHHSPFLSLFACLPVSIYLRLISLHIPSTFPQCRFF